MNAGGTNGAGADAEIAALIEALHRSEQRLEELTGGQVDAVVGGSGRPFVLRRAQEQLRHGEAIKQAAILNALPAQVALLDAEGVIVSVNEAWRQFATANYLAGPAFAVGVSYLEVCDRARGTDSAEAKRTAAGIRSVLAGAPSFSIEYPCHAPAERRWFLMTVTPLAHPGTGGVVIMHLNITGRKQAEALLQRQQSELRVLIDLVPAMIVFKGADNIIRRVNQRFAQSMGKSVGDLEGKTSVEVFCGDAAAYDVDDLKVMTEGLPATGVAKRGRDLAGREVWRQIDKVPVRDREGNADGLVIMIQDITERMSADLALQKSEKRFKALFEQAAVGVAQLDMGTGRYLQVNRRFCEIVGRGADEMEQLTFADVTHPQDIAQSQEMARRLREGMIREYTQEKRYVQAGRADVWASVTVSAMWAVGDPPDFFIVVAQDITQRKQLEDQLRQAHKMEAIGTLAGGIAHDFNNLLTAIGGYTQLALMKLADNPGTRGHLDSVVLAVKRAADLVRQILAFSREQPLDRQVIQLQPIVAECVALLRVTLPASIELILEAPADVPPVLADETQVLQVLMNLGTNARQALGDRPGSIHVKIENHRVEAAGATALPRLPPGPYVRVSFSDTGGGMAPEITRRIFEPFFTTKAPGKGTGLGLAVVHGIMDSHDGLITVSSQVGVGTVFHLYFPARIEASPVPPAAKALRGHGERVLLVDDEKLFIEVGRIALAELGYEVDVVMQPILALERVRAAPGQYSIVVTDQSMPGMNGLELAAALRKIRPDLPIVLTTGHSLTTTLEQIKAVGINQLLFKPITVHSLGAAMHAALSGQPITTHVSNPPY
jgi:PAS domain S-box-containing protein